MRSARGRLLDVSWKDSKEVQMQWFLRLPAVFVISELCGRDVLGHVACEVGVVRRKER